MTTKKLHEDLIHTHRKKKKKKKEKLQRQYKHSKRTS